MRANPALQPGTTSYTANPLNQYTTAASAGYSYDTNGQLAGDGVYSYGFDPQNRLVTAVGAGNTASDAYDAAGRRVAKTVDGVMADETAFPPIRRL